MLLFYATDIQSEIIRLDENDSKHAIRVLRLQSGDLVHVVDGKGNLYECHVLDAHPKKCVLSIQNGTFQKNPFEFLTIAVAPTKNNNRYEWFLEKATEIGIGRIIPIVTTNSERRTIKPERMEKIVIAAMKQSLKSYLPELSPVVEFKEVISQFDPNQSNLLIAHCHEDPTKMSVKKGLNRDLPTILLIGPEGDFTEEEVSLAKEMGFKAVTLGDTRLRTETAAISACVQLNINYHE
jgi:16S rRNA (uracil1498-N3)-methyltransferase